MSPGQHHDVLLLVVVVGAARSGRRPAASPVPAAVGCSTNSISRSAGRARPASWSPTRPGGPTTTTTRPTSSSARASRTWRTMGRPHSRCRGLGRSERIRVPSPAARTTAESGARSSAPFFSAAGAARACGMGHSVPACRTSEWSPYDEFGLFHENAAEFGLPYAGPPDVRRVEVEVAPGPPAQQPGLGRPALPSWCCCTAGPRTPTPGTPSPWPSAPAAGRRPAGPRPLRRRARRAPSRPRSNGRRPGRGRRRAGARGPRRWSACRSAA